MSAAGHVRPSLLTIAIIEHANSKTLETAVQDDKVMQNFELESLAMGADHSQRVKAAPIASDYSSKDCVNLSSSTAVFRITRVARQVTSPLRTPTRTILLNKRIYEFSEKEGKSRSEASAPPPISRSTHFQQIFRVTADSEVRLDDDAENFFPTFYD